MTPEQDKQCDEIIAHFGLDPQVRKLREELKELLDESQQPIDWDSFVGEAADVLIVLNQLVRKNNLENRVDSAIEYKLQRTKKRISSKYYESNKHK